MTDPQSPPAAPVPATTEAKPAKRPGIIRKSAVILLLVLAVLLVLAFPLVIEPWLVGKVRSSLAGQGLKLNDDAKLDISLFGGRLTGENIKLDDAKDGHLVFSASKLDGDVAVMDSLVTFDLIIDELTARDAVGDLRRRSDGSIPILAPDETGAGVNWWEYY